MVGPRQQVAVGHRWRGSSMHFCTCSGVGIEPYHTAYSGGRRGMNRKDLTERMSIAPQKPGSLTPAQQQGGCCQQRHTSLLAYQLMRPKGPAVAATLPKR